MQCRGLAAGRALNFFHRQRERVSKNSGVANAKKNHFFYRLTPALAAAGCGAKL